MWWMDPPDPNVENIIELNHEITQCLKNESSTNKLDRWSGDTVDQKPAGSDLGSFSMIFCVKILIFCMTISMFSMKFLDFLYTKS